MKLWAIAVLSLGLLTGCAAKKPVATKPGPGWMVVKKEWIIGALADRNTCEPYGKDMLCHDVVISFAAFEPVKEQK